ncbi:MAG: TetR/AcrR family transcriptional regulator [Cyanobacteria bacterium P01_F01_bin.143]
MSQDSAKMRSRHSRGASRSQPRQARSQERVNQILDAAEKLFIREGYEATKMRALAQAADVPIGSIYQFFKDKSEILQALHVRYLEFFQQRLDALDEEMMMQLPLPEYVEQVVDFCNQFLIDFPGYYAIFTQVQGLSAGWQKLEDSLEAEILRDWALELSQRDPSLTKKDCEAIAFVLLKTIDNLLWLAQGQDPEFRDRLVQETKRFTLSYLQSYCGRSGSSLWIDSD